MVDLTILEVHLDSAELTANTPFSDETTSGGGSVGGVFGGDEDSETADDESSGGASPFAVVFAFVGLIVLTVVLRRVLGGSGEPVLEE
ncbi:hypothetical protein BRD06_09120 [Halobacteriales archaeon QS_9_67_15]|nr:MAG: hypothetical protein BRD06_09120 [Halobacteriales archaeon QS_9_67_15]